MRRLLPATLFSVSLTVLASSSLFAQDRFAYAITDLYQDGAGWNALRRLDLQTGQYSQVLLNGADQSIVAFDAATKKQLTTQPDARYGNLLQAPFATGVAAAAYDRKHNRLYFTPMFVDQLRYVDLKTMQVYHVDAQPFTKAGTMHNDEAKIITRMVIAPDGYGYAISNDGNTFIRFSTGKKAAIEQLGSLVDDPSNNGISIHNRCSSFGGDMIADDKGNLIILSARNHVFSVNVESKVAKHVGTIQDLPANFTVNGAVVDAQGSLLVSSAVDGSSYYSIDSKSWKAVPYALPGGVFRSSDLANGNFLLTTSTQPAAPVMEVKTARKRPEAQFAKLISVYPNPVTSNNVTLQFNKVPAGDYVIELTDVLGRTVMQRRLVINNESQTQTLSIDRSSPRGTYMIRIADRGSKLVFSQTLSVQ